MPEPRIVEVTEAIRTIAGFGLPGQRADRIAVDDADLQGIAHRISAEKITGLAVAASSEGLLTLPRHGSSDLAERHRRAMTACLRIEQRLLVLDQRFSSAGVGYAVLKGPAVAHTAYADPSLRGFADLDVLVRTEDFSHACALVRAMGFTRRMPEPRPGFDVRFGKAAVHRHDDDGMEIDLHRTLALGPFGLWVEPGTLLERTTTFPLAGRSIPRLDDSGVLLNVAMHAVLGWPPALLPFRDIVEVSRTMSIDWGWLADVAERWHITSVIDHAFRTAGDTLRVRMPPETTGFERRPDPRQAAALRAYLGERRGLGGTAVSTLRAIPGLRAKAAYMTALAFPRREFMERRYRFGQKGSYGHRLMTPGRWAWRRLGAVGPKEM